MATISRRHRQRQRHDNDKDSNASDAPSSLRLTGAARRMQVLVETNALLATLGFGARAFEDYDDLVASVSSMSVALYESLFQFHLDDVVRVPATSDDYVFNAQLVVDALSGALLDEHFDAQQLTGESLCRGDVASIQQLITMFHHIHEILYTSESSGQAREMQAGYDDRSVQEKEDSPGETTPPRRPQPEKEVTAPQRKKRSDQQTMRSRTTTTTAVGGVISDSGERRVLREAAAVTKSRTPTPSQATTIKKRTRRVESNVHQTWVATGGKLNRKNEELEQQLLTTQRYGRYVPVPKRSTSRVAEPHDDQYDDKYDDDCGASGVELTETELVVGETYFGGVSSVSGASGSAASIHFMEEEGEFAKNFSAIQSHSSPGTNSKDSPETDSTPDRSGRVHDAKPRKSKNQQEAEEENRGSKTGHEADEEEGTTSPVKKKVATARATTLSPNQRPRARARDGPTRVQTSPSSKPSLYPLLPKTKCHDRNSKAHKEYMRYKLQLKDHLQELRQREFCQRQHLERAYRLGEHTANVERIRARRFEQELRLHRLSIGLDAKTQEEKQLRDAMQQLLHLEKEKLRDEHRTTAKALKQIQREHAEREQSLETFYATQIQLVKEQTRRELNERETVEKAHRMASEQMIREMRRERERELATLLTEKQHLADVRRFRHTTQLTQAIEKGTEISARQGDAFYAAAMKARQLRTATTSDANRRDKMIKRSTTTKPAPKRTQAIYTNRSTVRTAAVRVGRSHSMRPGELQRE